MAQKLIVRPLAMLSEALGSVPGCVTVVSHPRELTIVYNSSTEDPMLSSTSTGTHRR